MCQGLIFSRAWNFFFLNLQVPFILFCHAHLSVFLLHARHLSLLLWEVASYFFLSRDSLSQFCFLLRWCVLMVNTKMILRREYLPTLYHLKVSKREKDKIVHFMLPAMIRLSGRGRQGTSWLSVGIVSYVCRTNNIYLVQISANLEITFMEAYLGLMHYHHIFKALFLTRLASENCVKIYCIQDTVQYVSFCVCDRQNWQVFYKWAVYAN